MPVGPLTKEEIAELRRNIATADELHAPGPWQDATRLLDGVEELRELLRRALESADDAVPHGSCAPCEGKPPCWCARARELVETR